MIEIYTDGSSRGNPGPGGYGVTIVQDNEIIYAYSQQFNNITNNQAELRAIIHAFQLAQERYSKETCIIYSDSAYCVNMCNDWIFGWARNGWKNTKKKTVENLDLVLQLYEFLSQPFFHCQVRKTSGHSGIIQNEIADALATDDNLKLTKLINNNNLILKEYYQEQLDLCEKL